MKNGQVCVCVSAVEQQGVICQLQAEDCLLPLLALGGTPPQASRFEAGPSRIEILQSTLRQGWWTVPFWQSPTQTVRGGDRPGVRGTLALFCLSF